MAIISAYSEKLKNVIKKINAQHGAGAIRSLGDAPNPVEILCSTGSIGLDIALGVKGYPKGRMVEIFGPESSGKTTLSLHAIAEAQKKGVICGFVDAEHAYDFDYAASLGVNNDLLLFAQPDTGEEGLDIVQDLAESGEVGLIVIDSVAALIPKAELEGEMGESKVGLHARLMSQACRKLISGISKSGTVVIFINQLREKIGIMFGNPEVTTGGNALKYYASIRLDVRRSTSKDNTVMDGDVKMGNLTKVSVVKNKVAPPFKVATFNIMYGTGISRESEILSCALNMGILIKTGSGVLIGYETPTWDIDTPIGSTEDRAIETLKSEGYEDLYSEVSLKVYEALNQITKEECESKLLNFYEKAYLKNTEFDSYFERGSIASGKSKHVEAHYYFKKCLDLKPLNKKAKEKFKAVDKRILERLAKGEKLDFIIINEKDEKVDTQTGEIIIEKTPETPNLTSNELETLV